MDIALATDRWLPVSGYDGMYEVSHRGTVRSVDRWVYGGHGRVRFARGRVLRPRRNRHGYLDVTLTREGIKRSCNVHVLVLEAFTGPRPPGLVARHGPGGQLDNRWPENLCWGTTRENSDDKCRDGTMLFGSALPYAKLTEAIVRHCRERHAVGDVTYQRLADEYGVSRQTMSRAVTGQLWRHVI